MSAPKHTPWTFKVSCVVDATGEVVAALNAGRTEGHLVAAAPDLLEVVRDLLNAHDGAVNVSDDPFPEDLNRADEWVARLRELLAKAEGRTP